jgi:hypothetical protein
VIKDGNFIPRHTVNSDEVSDKESQASDRFHCTSATMDAKRSVFTFQWALHGLMIQGVLFVYASSVATDLKMQQWLQQN